MTDIELFQFQYSHFNEKVRWALDWKGIPHRRTSLLPGPHMMRIKRMTGQTATPVLRIGDDCVFGSARIVSELERLCPERPLLPVNEDEKQRALELQDWLDVDFGPFIRRALFSTLIDEDDYICAMFSRQRSWPVRALYRASYPLAKGMIRKGNGVTGQAAIDEAFHRTEEVLDRVVEELTPAGYLVGDRFSLADLTAASLAAAAFNPPDSPMTRPHPMPHSMQHWLERWRGHAAGDYVLRMYRDHRQVN
jgi:glutathione S-transferase